MHDWTSIFFILSCHESVRYTPAKENTMFPRPIQCAYGPFYFLSYFSAMPRVILIFFAVSVITTTTSAKK